MSTFDKSFRNTLRMVSPVTRFVSRLRNHGRRNRNLRELERLDNFMREDIGMFN